MIKNADFVENLKNEIKNVNKIILLYSGYTENINNKCQFLEKKLDDPDRDYLKIMEGMKKFKEDLKAMKQTNEELIDKLVHIASVLETIYLSHIINITIDDGRKITFNCSNKDIGGIELTPNDLWFLKIVKKTLGIKDLELIEKEDK